MRILRTIALLLLLVETPPAANASVFVTGEVPDWDQPYTYVGAPHGPGPNPAPGAVDPYDAWCGPASASNLLGHWEDVRGVPSADGVTFALSTPPNAPIPWPGPPIWHDWDLGSLRPPPGPTPTSESDVAWFMDTNASGSTLRSNGPHSGTYTKDLHVGLAELLVHAAVGSPGIGLWTTGTRAGSFALGTDASGAAATPHASAASAFAEIVGEINANRTAIVTWLHWNVSMVGSLPPSMGAMDESQFGGDYYTFNAGPPPADPWGNDEVWPEDPIDPLQNLGHIVTAVGYIPAGGPDDINAPGNPTDWVIVHDNVAGTHRNVIVPLTAAEYASVWVANTNAQRVGDLPMPIPSMAFAGRLALVAVLLAASLPVAWRLSRRRAER